MLISNCLATKVNSVKLFSIPILPFKHKTVVLLLSRFAVLQCSPLSLYVVEYENISILPTNFVLPTFMRIFKYIFPLIL